MIHWTGLVILSGKALQVVHVLTEDLDLQQARILYNRRPDMIVLVAEILEQKAEAAHVANYH